MIQKAGFTEVDRDLENAKLSINSINDEKIEIVISQCLMMCIYAKTKYVQEGCVEIFLLKLIEKKESKRAAGSST